MLDIRGLPIFGTIQRCNSFLFLLLWGTPAPEHHIASSRCCGARLSPNTISPAACCGARLNPNTISSAVGLSWARTPYPPNTCQTECHKDCQIECHNICQTGCQKECQKECQNICQIECQIECRIVCGIECHTECQIECMSGWGSLEVKYVLIYWPWNQSRHNT